MEFYTSSNLKRPIRLSDATRKFAYDSLNRKYGLETLNNGSLPLDHIENFESLTELEKYNIAIFEIATKAPLRICDGELISGSATLGGAIRHVVPVTYNNKNIFSSISHLTVNFPDVLELGIDGIREKVKKSLLNHTEKDKIDFLNSCLHCIDCMEIWHKRYIHALREKGYDKNAENLLNVPFRPAKNFYEAVQSIWFAFAFLRLCGNWPGIGRIDVMLGKFLKNDLENNVLTLDKAREILAHFFIKGCEWTGAQGASPGSGDAQHYQNLVLSGIDEHGNDVTNEVTHLVLDIIEETGISDFPTTVRINKNSDSAFVDRVSDVIRYGGGVIAVYNEDLILESLRDAGYPEDEITSFANDGCWEVQIPGKTYFTYLPFDSLKILQQTTLKGFEDSVSFNSFEELLKQYTQDLSDFVDWIFEDKIKTRFIKTNTGYWRSRPCSVVSLFETGCIEKGMSYADGGPVYNVVSPHIGGTADTANSLYAIKKAVFDDKLLSFSEFMEILRNNWDGNESLRLHMLNNYLYFGNDNDEVDEIAAYILNSFSDMCREYRDKTEVKFLTGVSTFGRQLEWAPNRIATPFGRKKGEILSGNFSPTPGTDKNSVPAIIKSYCKADLKKQHTGAALDISVAASTLENENATAVISGLIKSFVDLGGYFMQIDTVSKETLLKAQENPEDYNTLSVRISGWNARFVTLSKEWQDMVIDRI